jgi:pimeloyl-ACP methyl ester carboxylesterase
LTTVLYLHGFASSPRGRKASALAALLAPEGIVFDAPDLNVPSFAKLEYSAMVERAADHAHRSSASALVGSSLGALVALDVSRHGVLCPLVLIAPALGFGKRWTEKLPPGDPVMFFHHAVGRELPIHRDFFNQIVAVDVDRQPPASQVTVIIGNKDESVPFGQVLDVWHRWERSGALAKGSHFLEIPGGDHALTDHIQDIAREIRAAIR